jgi:hypothetical protein
MTLSNQAPKAGRSKAAKARKALTQDQLFFYEHAGYSYDPKTETAEQGRIRCAMELARAEAYGRTLGYSFEWRDDWEIGSHKDYFGDDSAYAKREPDTCEQCTMLDTDGKRMPFALGCIDDADANYRRVIEAELAEDAIAALDKEIETLDAH